jgi:hypothetical protein
MADLRDVCFQLAEPLLEENEHELFTLILEKICTTDKQRLEVIYNHSQKLPKNVSLEAFNKITEEGLNHLAVELKCFPYTPTPDEMRRLEQASESMKTTYLRTGDLTFDDRCYCRIKACIMKSMIEQNQPALALQYCKKALVTQNKNYVLQGKLITCFAKLYEAGSGKVEMGSILKLIKETSLKLVPVQLYDHLLFQVNSSGKSDENLKSLTNIYESKLSCSTFEGDIDTWVTYYHMLKNDYNGHTAAQKVLKRGLQACKDKQKLMKASL